MSSRSKRTSTARQEKESGTGSRTSSPSTSFTSPGRTRPPSPTMIARVQEKAELAGLNDRLATYIDRVRTLQNENSRLTKQVQTQEETIHRETTNIKALYESELSDARKLLDETAKEKAKLQLDVSKYKGDYEDLKEKYNQQARDFSATQKRLLSAESQVNDLQARLSDAVGQRKHFEDEYNKLKKEYDALIKQLAAVKKQLEDEMVGRVDLENRVQSLKEELQFKSQVHEQEMNETISRSRVEIEEVDGKLTADYESRLADALRDMREQNDEAIRATREESQEVFAKQLADLRAVVDKNDNLAKRYQEEVTTYRTRINDMSSELSKLRSQNAAQEAHINDLKNNFAQEQEDHKNSVASRDAEIRRLQEALDDQLVEYQDLLDIKIQLDTEISAYRKLLESEEYRLNISTEGTPAKSSVRQTPSRATPAQSRKRKRIDIESEGSLSRLGAMSQSSSNTGFSSTSSSKGALEVNDIDTEGKFIKVSNNSETKDQPVGGWQLKLKGGNEETTFKFHRSSSVKAGQSVTVWSADSNTAHQPPSDLVMKGQKWFTSDNMEAVLVNNQGEEMASKTMQRSTLRTTYTRSRDAGELQAAEVGSEHIFHQQGDPRSPCRIM